MRYSLYLPPGPGDGVVLKVATAGLAAGTILTLVIHKDGIKYLKVEEVETLIDARKLKRAPADPGAW